MQTLPTFTQQYQEYLKRFNLTLDIGAASGTTLLLTFSSIWIGQMSSQLNHNLDNPETREVSLFDRIFRDREGRIVIAQPPNLPVLVGVAATILHLLLPIGKVQAVLGLVGFGALFTWAWQELFEGVNYFRRALGLLGLLGVVALGLTLRGI
jgi:hypothetical protein